MLCFCAARLAAYPRTKLLSDINGDSEFQILAFGDSITVGQGDTRVKGGYPFRLGEILHVLVKNDGISGEVLYQLGIRRYRRDLRRSNADLVILNEGNSDALLSDFSPAKYQAALINAIKYTRSLHKNLVLATQYPIFYHAGQANPRLQSVNSIILTQAAANHIRVADIARTYRTSCNTLPNCTLLLYHDGLHPNSTGYDLITRTILGAMSSINVFQRGGDARLQRAFSIGPFRVPIKPGS